VIGDILKKSIEEALDNLSLETKEVSLEHPTLLEHGDYSSNVALVLAKIEGKNPKELAELIIENIKRPEEVEKIEVASNGFINFFLSKDFFAKSLKEATEKDFGKNESLKDKKIILEYTDPNPFKVFHIGHLMSNTIGESLSRIAEYTGAETRRVNYQGDVGLHIAKAIWGIKNIGEEIITEEDLGKAYAYGARKFEEDVSVQSEVVEINRALYSKEDSEYKNVYDKGKEISLEAFEKIYERLGTKFDHYFFESEVGDFGKEVVEKHRSVFLESDGAIVFKGEEVGLHTRVFLNSHGIPTYEAKELGLAKIKHDYFPYDESYVITANEINDYFRVLIEVIKRVYEKEGFGEKTIHLGHGMLRLPSGKMSSRTGDVVSGEKMLNEIKDRVLEVMSEREVDNREKVADIIAVSAFKYSILRQAIGKDVIFDFDKSISFEGDSGPYLQYTYVRAKSVLDIAKAKGFKIEENTPDNWQVTKIEKMIYRFPEVVERAWTEKAPQYITTFLGELAGNFNSFYADERIAEEGGGYKLLITESVKNTLENGLYLLGIEVPDKM